MSNYISFGEALDVLNKGGKIRRSMWNLDDVYIVFTDEIIEDEGMRETGSCLLLDEWGNAYVSVTTIDESFRCTDNGAGWLALHLAYDQRPNEVIWMPTQEDILANDWLEVK